MIGSGSAGPGAGTPVTDDADVSRRSRELIEHAIGALSEMQLADGAFPMPRPPDSAPTQKEHSVRQTAIVLLGLLRIDEHGTDHPFHIGGIRGRLLADVAAERVSLGDLGLILWTESRQRGAAVEELVGYLADSLGVDGPGGVSGSELAWILTALTETGVREKLDAEGIALRDEARAELLARRRRETGLLQGPGHGPGKRFQSFESEVQAMTALAQLDRLTSDTEAGRAAVAIADRLLELQRDDGSWPAVIDTRRGAEVEPYPLTCVAQLALAPIGMATVSRLTEDPRYAMAARRGLAWVWGANELEVSLFDDKAGLARGIARRERLDRAHMFARAATSIFKPVGRHEARRTLHVDRTSSPADLGWILETWAGGADLIAAG